MNESKFVIVGGGMVAGYAAKQFVELGLGPGKLAILSSDTFAPYERPPLSKGFLAGRDTEESIRINSESFYREHGIELRLGCHVAGVNPRKKRVALKSGGEFGFEKLIIATGSKVRKLNVLGAELANVRYLRSVDDSKAIRQLLDRRRSALLVEHVQGDSSESAAKLSRTVGKRYAVYLANRRARAALTCSECGACRDWTR